jgi:hypothetical protein
MPRTISYWTWLLAYAMVSAALLAPLYIYRASMLIRGAFIESVPALILVAALLLSLGVAVALRRSGQRFVPWLLLALLCLILAGEEASWGREAVMGRMLIPADDKWDLHNWLVHHIGARVAVVDWTSRLGVVVASIVGLVATAAVLLAALRAIRGAKIGLHVGFLLIAAGWALLAMTVDFTDLALAHFYNRVGIYKWAIEESFAPLARGWQLWRGH